VCLRPGRFADVLNKNFHEKRPNKHKKAQKRNVGMPTATKTCKFFTSVLTQTASSAPFGETEKCPSLLRSQGGGTGVRMGAGPPLFPGGAAPLLSNFGQHN